MSTALVAWTDGVLWWWTGRICEQGQRVYARGYTANVAATARRIALRYEETLINETRFWQAPRGPTQVGSSAAAKT
jgi:hypothetical protein